MGLTQTKLHFKVLKENWTDVLRRLTTEKGIKEAKTQNPLGDLPLHFCCYLGKAPPEVIRALLEIYPESAHIRNKRGFSPFELAHVNYRANGPYRREVLELLNDGYFSWLRIVATRDERRDILTMVLNNEIYSASPEKVMASREYDDIIQDHESPKGAEGRKVGNINHANGEISAHDYACSHVVDNTCAICINDYENGEDIVTGNDCGHLFHKSCLLEWLENHNICPTCRKPVLAHEMMKNAAIEVLGERRATELTTTNLSIGQTAQ